MRNSSDNICRANLDTHFMSEIFFPENRAVYEIMWENMVETDRPEMAVWCGACALHAG
jgi:hypothetical protein